MSHRSAVPLRRERMRERLLTERSRREGARAKMIDMIEDNRYDTILQECDAVLAELLHTE